MRSKLFIGSSGEDRSVALAIQTNLERDFEATIWDQGVFDLSKSTLESLLNALDFYDFAVFVCTANDILQMRGQQHSAARDNVIFELGLFLGRLGKDRTYFVVPKNSPSLHLPSDLAGISYASYDADREDNNLQAALGPACHAITQASARAKSAKTPAVTLSPDPKTTKLDENDCISILESWLGSRPPDDNTKAIYYDETDQKLLLPTGTTQRLIAKAAVRWGLVVERAGSQTILLSRKLQVRKR
jgi:hypothetical protein